MELPSISEYAEVSAVLAEKIDRWGAANLEQGIKRGIERGIEQGIERQRALLHRLTERRFGPAAAERLSAVLAGVTGADRLAEAGEWIVDCATTADFLSRVSRAGSWPLFRLSDRSRQEDRSACKRDRMPGGRRLQPGVTNGT